MIQAVKQNAEERMDKAIQAFKKDLLTLRTGRANPAILDKVQVSYLAPICRSIKWPILQFPIHVQL